LELEDVVPWGRSFEEYGRMFDLAPDDVAGSMLDCASGPSSFNAEATRKGYQVISCDPIYRFSAREISSRIDETCEIIVAGARTNKARYVWDIIGSPEELGEIRMATMRRFLEDFPQGFALGRYRTDALPDLGFEDDEFDLALCSHLLFTYSEQLTLDFHVASIKEMCRVADEARIFPLLTYDGEQSPLFVPVVDELRTQGYETKVRPVPYEFQRGGDLLLSVSRQYR
jgi:hypothetical protein